MYIYKYLFTYLYVCIHIYSIPLSLSPSLSGTYIFLYYIDLYTLITHIYNIYIHIYIIVMIETSVKLSGTCHYNPATSHNAPGRPSWPQQLPPTRAVAPQSTLRSIVARRRRGGRNARNAPGICRVWWRENNVSKAIGSTILKPMQIVVTA